MRRAALLLAVLTLAAGATGAGAQEPPRVDERPAGERADGAILRSIPGDHRSTVVLRYDCASEVGRREVTLFANGTIRLWDGPRDEQEMVLAELDPDALDGFVERLAAVDLSEEPTGYHGVDGEWVEQCVLELPLREGRGPWRFEINRYSSLSLGLSRLVRVAEELGAVADEARGGGLDDDYRPRRGDILERTDGALFRVVDFTSDGKGLELEGVDLPLTLYLSPDALREVFARVVSRRDEWR